MHESYIPKIDPGTMCEVLKMCSVRKDTSGQDFLVIKRLDGTQKQVLAKDIVQLDVYEEKKIERIYCSGHVFLSDDKKKIYLVKTRKLGYEQRQFTGGSPKEEYLKSAHYIKDGILKFDLEKLEHNAWIRTRNRTSVNVTDIYNDLPLVDRVLNENIDPETEEIYRNLVFLLHHYVKSYIGTLEPQIGVEDVMDGAWFDIENLPGMSNVSPNAYIITKAFTSGDYDRHIQKPHLFSSLLARIDYYFDRVTNTIMMFVSSWRYSFHLLLLIFGLK